MTAVCEGVRAAPTVWDRRRVDARALCRGCTDGAGREEGSRERRSHCGFLSGWTGQGRGLVYGVKEDTEDVDDIEAMEETKDVEDIEGTKGTEDMEDMADMEGTALSSTVWPSAQEPAAGTSGWTPGGGTSGSRMASDGGNGGRGRRRRWAMPGQGQRWRRASQVWQNV